jgi:hypothetical protein
MALLPAAALFGLGLLNLARTTPPRVHTLSLLLALASAALLALAIVGLLLQRSVRLEPEWMTGAVEWTGLAFLALVAGFGLTAFSTRPRRRPAYVILALSLPVGFAIDAALGRIPGIFLAGAGFGIGFGLFAIAVIRIGLRSGLRIRAGDDQSAKPAAGVQEG